MPSTSSPGGRWWLRDYSINRGSPIADVVIEPKVGGRWYERGEDGTECQWGTVLAWEPPGQLVLAWQIDGTWKFDQDLITEFELRFVADGAGRTRVELEHRHLQRLGESADGIREALESPAGWSGLLRRFSGEIDAPAAAE